MYRRDPTGASSEQFALSGDSLFVAGGDSGVVGVYNAKTGEAINADLNYSASSRPRHRRQKVAAGRLRTAHKHNIRALRPTSAEC
jgi:hypothetical protein